MKQFKNLILAGALAVGLAGFAVSCNRYGDDIEEIRNELASLRTGQVATVESQLASLQGTVSGLTSAKEALEKTVSGLESQLKSAASSEEVAALEADIAALKAADAALEAKIAEINKTLETFVTKSDLDATLASYATVKEVAEAVAEVQAALNKYVKSNDEAIAAEVAKLEAAIAKAQEEAVAAAGKAFEAAFQTSFDAAAAAANLVDASALKAEVDAYDAKIKAYIAAAILDNGGNVNEEIGAQISEAIANLQKLLSGRLTSVVFIPDLYVGGIEAISLNTFEYSELTVTSDAKTEAYAYVLNSKKEYADRISAGSTPTTIRYHVSPTHLSAEDIEAPKFVFEKATTRAAYNVDLLNVLEYEVNNGELSVTVNKASNVVLPSEDEESTIVTAAVRVPIAEKNLVEGETNAVVYSDYARLIETAYVPKIAALIDHSEKPAKTDGVFADATYDAAGKFVENVTSMYYTYDVKDGRIVSDNTGYHFSAWFDDASKAAYADPNDVSAQGKNENTPVANELLYNQSYDLLQMVTGCYFDGKKHVEITKEELEKYGFEFRFALPVKPYGVGNNKTDQQQFAKIDGSMISAKLPNGVMDNKAAVGRTPVVRVELVDINNNKIVDVRYFRIKWVDKVIIDKFEKTFDDFNYTLSCANFTGTITWSKFVTEVLANVTEGGMSYAEFVNYYDIEKATIASKDHKLNGTGTKNDGVNVVEGNANSNLEINFVEETDSYDQKTASLVWTLTAEQIGTVMTVNGTQTVFEKNVTVTIPTKSTAGALILNLKVNIKLPVLPAFNGTQSTFWEKPGEVANVYPIIYNSPVDVENNIKAGDLGKEYEYVKYEYDFDRLFADNQIVKNMLPCGKWDLQFAYAQSAVSSINGVGYMYGGAFTEPSMLGDGDGHSLRAIVDGPSMALDGDVAAAFEFANFADYDYESDAYDGRSIDDGAWYSAEKAPLKDGAAEKAATHKSVKADITLNVTEESETTGSVWGKSILTMSNERGSYVDDKLFAVNVWAAVNDYNPYLVKTFNIRFIAPFYVNTKAAGKFTDMVVSGSEVKVSDLLTMTDFNGYTVGTTNGTTEKTKYATALWHYYNVDDPQWKLGEAMTNLKKVGDNYEAVEMEAKDATISAKDRFGEGALELSPDKTKVIFKNVSGVPIESNVQIFIPVTITHKWGTFTQYISVTLQPRQ